MQLDHRLKMWALWAGGATAVIGLVAVIFLAYTGHDTAALGIGAVLTTLVSIFIGKKVF